MNPPKCHYRVGRAAGSARVDARLLQGQGGIISGPAKCSFLETLATRSMCPAGAHDGTPDAPRANERNVESGMPSPRSWRNEIRPFLGLEINLFPLSGTSVGDGRAPHLPHDLAECPEPFRPTGSASAKIYGKDPHFDPLTVKIRTRTAGGPRRSTDDLIQPLIGNERLSGRNRFFG